MKTTINKIILSLAVLFLAASCELITPPESGGGGQGTQNGNVIVRIGEVDARTIVPSVTVADFDSFRLTFTAEEGRKEVVSDLTSKQVTAGVPVKLEAGIVWYVKAEAFIMELSGYNPLIPGSETPTAVSSGTDSVYIFGEEANKPVILNLVLYPNPAGTEGWLSWERDFLELVTPGSNYSATLNVYKVGESTLYKKINLLNLKDTNNIGEVVEHAVESDDVLFYVARLPLDKGKYQISIDVKGNGTTSPGLTELVSIYANLETRLPFKVEDILGYKPLSGTIQVAVASTNNTLTNLSRARITVYAANSNTQYGTPVEITSSTTLQTQVPWKVWVPIGIESARVKVDFHSGTNWNTIIRSDIRPINNIGIRGKDGINLSYNTQARTFSNSTSTSWNSFNVTTSGSSTTRGTITIYNNNNLTSTSNNLIYNSTSAPTGSSTALRVFQGVTLELRVTYNTGYILNTLTVSQGSGSSAVTVNVLEEYEGDANRGSYFVTLQGNNNITVSATMKSTSGNTIVCLGDSITEGIGEGNWAGEDDSRSYPAYLEAMLSSNVDVMNSGIAGFTTKDGLEILREMVIDYNPTDVIINFGLNDVMQEFINKDPAHNFAVTQQSLFEIVRKLYDGKRRIYVAKFLTEPMLQNMLAASNVPVDRQREVLAKYYDANTGLYANLKKAYPNVVIINDIWKSVWGKDAKGNDIVWNYAVHDVHPRAGETGTYGYWQMAKNIYDAIASSLPSNYK